MLIKIFFTVIFWLILFPVSVYAVDISADKAVVINAETKEVIYEKNSHKKASMASTTKIMTSILAIESGRMKMKFTATDEVYAEGTSIGLKSGDIITLEALVYGMLLESGNDASNLAAIAVSGNTDSFAELMNSKANEIGMVNSSFVTPSGLDDEMHYSTAYDMALLGAYCIKNPIFREICSSKTKKASFIEPKKSVTFFNHNRLLGSCEGVFGIKTGFTRKSGRCLITACERSGVTMICVTLNAPDDWKDHEKLYDYAFSDVNFSTIKAFESKSINIYGSVKNTVKIRCEEYKYTYTNTGNNLDAIVYIPEIIYAPVYRNDIIGRVDYYDGEIYVGSAEIYADEDAFCTAETYKDNKSIFDIIRDFISERIIK